ncbi:unnamed protein product [Parascedosporium putredinis]|uniref:Mitochondrial import inner membrane translocase subunit TIM22 n=1 Tax=Parascedosporium putredinis TaxID=1442378 RepID=A0A9P1GU65_9PEZI|nr:unnamed protein product [Parascedosporium putredinis]CAI7987408.1 unnamed protein product [Parascedosporium putredinis]
MNFPRPQMSEADQATAMAKTMENAMQNCFIKSAISGVMGFGMGGVFGLFMASMAYDTPYHTVGAGGAATPSPPSPPNFGKVGALFAGIECGVEGFRAKNDLANGAISGCLTGAILARNAGPGAAAGGCAAFAAFGLAIDAWMRQPKDE